jgi:preprotein translocase subunit SecB
MENTKKASFSIEKYYFNKVHIDMTYQTSDELYVDFNPTGQFIEKESKYVLSFIFSAFSVKEKNTAPFLQVNCIGVFNFQDVKGKDDIPEFFYRNSIAILFPYMRAYVSMVTNQANISQIMLPTLNLSALEKPLKENTTVIKDK